MTDRRTLVGAYAKADAAHKKIEDHEELCAERYARIHEVLGELKEDSQGQLRLLMGILCSVAGFALVTLMAIVLHALKLA